MAKANDLKVNDLVKMNNNNYSSYGYHKGVTARVSYKSGNTINIISEGKNQIAVGALDLEKCAQTKEEIGKEIKRLEGALKDRKDKLKWMEDTKSEVYDEDEFKVWQILSTMDSKSSKIDKARAIAAIVKK